MGTRGPCRSSGSLLLSIPFSLALCSVCFSHQGSTFPKVSAKKEIPFKVNQFSGSGQEARDQTVLENTGEAGIVICLYWFSVGVIDARAERLSKERQRVQLVLLLCPRTLSQRIVSRLPTHRTFSEVISVVPGSPDSTRTPRNVSPRLCVRVYVCVCVCVRVSVCVCVCTCCLMAVVGFLFLFCFARIFQTPSDSFL